MRGVFILLFAFPFVAAAPAFSAIYKVGPNRDYKTIAGVPTLKPGDAVEIDPGTYREYRNFTESGAPGKPIVLRGVGDSRPILDGTGLNVSGEGKIPRALFQFSGDHYLVENLEFRNATNGHNGAGIRVTGAKDVTIRECRISRCEMGIMSDSCDQLLIEKCEIAFNGNPTGFNGYAHNLYLGGNRATVRYCWIHDAIAGMNFKTRGHYTELLYNWIADSNEGELSIVDGDAETSTPNSDAVLIGNVIVSKPDRTGNHGKFIDFGQDTGRARNGTLYLYHNTLIAGSSQISFLSCSAPGAKIAADNNIFYGSDQIATVNRGSISGSNDWLPKSATAPAGFAASIRGATPGFVSLAGKNFHLAIDSPCRGAGLAKPTYRDGDGAMRSGRPGSQIATLMSVVSRRDALRPDVGAYGYAYVAPPKEDPLHEKKDRPTKPY